MAKKKPSALDALARLNEERRSLNEREAELKRAAALELGLVVIDAGGAAIGPVHLRSLIAQIVAIGVQAASDGLGAKIDPSASPTRKQPRAADEEVRHG